MHLQDWENELRAHFKKNGITEIEKEPVNETLIKKLSSSYFSHNQQIYPPKWAAMGYIRELRRTKIEAND